MGKREEAAKQFNVNPHYMSDGVRLLKFGRDDLLTKVQKGEMSLQEALRELGCYTQRDRNRHRAKIVESLCHAVLEYDLQNARPLAAQLLASRLRGAKREEFLNSHGFTQKT
jgi:hypothetical protein